MQPFFSHHINFITIDGVFSPLYIVYDEQNLYHVFNDFIKAFDRVWHAAIWATMRKYNIIANLIRTVEQLCDKATCAV